MTTTAPPTFDLGEDVTEVRFKIGGTEFTVFPLDQLESIHRLALPPGGPAAVNEAFWLICQNQLKAHGVTASLQMSGRWYDALLKAHEGQAGFFVESPASPGSTGSSPEAAGDNSAATNSGSSKPSKTRSKRKN